MFNQYNPLIQYGMPSRFSFTSLLNNAQKTLNIVNQALPIVKEVRPIVHNARTLFSVAKGFNNIDNSPIEQKLNNNVVNSTNSNDDNSNGLNFFI